MAKPQPGQLLDLQVDSLAYGGSGVARLDGYVIFVEGGLPGDHLRAKVVQTKRGFAKARAAEIIQPGPGRVEPQCTHAGEPCPGAPWQLLDYRSQLEAKQAQLKDALERIGKLDGFELEQPLPAASVWRYRNKLEYSFGADGQGRAILGFHSRGHWWQIVDVEDCLLASESSNEIRNFVRLWSRERGFEPYDRHRRSGLLRNLVVREARATGQGQVTLAVSNEMAEDELAAFRDALMTRFTKVQGLIVAISNSPAESLQQSHFKLVAGESWIEERALGLNFRISAEAFFQTNSEMAERLFETALEYADLKPSERLFDIYCGIGTVGLLMSAKAGEVFGIDIVDRAIENAEVNAQINGISNAHFSTGNARTAIRPLIERAGKADVVVLDPPRSGLSQKVVRRVIETGAQRIVYISCNPTTLAPNAAQLTEAGYRLIKVRLVDMFPNTPHIECVALLVKGLSL